MEERIFFFLHAWISSGDYSVLRHSITFFYKSPVDQIITFRGLLSEHGVGSKEMDNLEGQCIHVDKAHQHQKQNNTFAIGLFSLLGALYSIHLTQL